MMAMISEQTQWHVIMSYYYKMVTPLLINEIYISLVANKWNTCRRFNQNHVNYIPVIGTVTSKPLSFKIVLKHKTHWPHTLRNASMVSNETGRCNTNN